MRSSNDLREVPSLQKSLFTLYKRSYSEIDVDPTEIIEKLNDLIRFSGDQSEAQKAIIDRYTRLVQLALHQRFTDLPITISEAVVQPVKRRWPIIVTSVNPFGRTEVQSVCFNRWKDLGFEIVTCNSESEIAPLADLGIGREAVIKLEAADTGEKIHGKPVPKIVSTLEKAAAISDRDILLVNSDLYPEVKNGLFVEQWQEMGTAIGLVREDQLALGAYVTGISRPYTNGLDAFLLPRSQLPSFLKQLKLLQVAERMCFGIVGWDFLMGALVLHNGGTIRNSDVLIHEYHETTYSEISEFRHYNDAMQALGFGADKDYPETAEIFAQTIKEYCAGSRSSLPLRRAVPELTSAGLGRNLQLFYHELEQDIPEFLLSFGQTNMVGLLKMIEKRSDFSLAEQFKGLQQLETMTIFSLQIIAFLARRRVGAQSGEAVRFDYPAGNKHADMLRHIRDQLAHKEGQMRCEIAGLFFTELAEYNIFNDRIFNFLALCCENDTERSLLEKVRNLKFEGVSNVA